VTGRRNDADDRHRLRIVLRLVDVHGRPAAVRLERDQSEIEARRVLAAGKELNVSDATTLPRPNDDHATRLVHSGT